MTTPTSKSRPRKRERAVAIRITTTEVFYAVLLAAALAIAHYRGVTVGMKAAPLAELRERSAMLDSARAQIQRLTAEAQRAPARAALNAQAQQLGGRR